MVDTTDLTLSGSIFGPPKSLGYVSEVNTAGVVGHAWGPISSKLGNVALKNPVGTE